MPITNNDVAEKFNLMGDLLELQEANEFRVRSYRNAARTIQSLSTNVRDMVEKGEDLQQLSGIGEDLSAKIKEFVETGTAEALEQLKEEVPLGLVDLLQIEGLGPKKVKKLWDVLGITSVEELEQAAREHRIQEVKGFGEKTEQSIIDHMEEAGREETRTLWMNAHQVAEPLESYLDQLDVVNRVEVAGSYRRRKETVGDLDFLVISDDGETVADHFTSYEDVSEVLSEGKTKSSVILRDGMQVDIRVISRESYGAALMYFTGSKEHNVALRQVAVDEGYKINEYGVFDENEKQVAGEAEDEIYEFFDCSYIIPELRENRGEIEAAQQGKLPEPIELDDLRGDLHCHTEQSDGNNSLETMAKTARDMGHDYLAITDHSKHLGVTNGLDAKRLTKQMKEIEELNDHFDSFRLLKGSEVDLERSGALTLTDEILKQLDIVIVAVHTNFGLSESNQTDRVVRALNHPHVHGLAHSTARRINDRKPIQLDMEAVFAAAESNNCFLEINAQPDRLDLNDIHAKVAREHGLKFSISTDAHSTRTLNYQQYGVYQARRGWLEADDILNTLSWPELKKRLS